MGSRAVRLVLLICLAAAGCATAEDPALDPESTLVLTLEDGQAVIAMRPDVAPVTVDRVKSLVRAGAYDGLLFERGIPNLLVQIEAPTKPIEGVRPAKTIAGAQPTEPIGARLPAELSALRFGPGTVGMARGSAPDSSGAFFITLEDAPGLDGQFTVWGQVVRGMTFIGRIRKSRGNPQGFIALEPKIPPEPRFEVLKKGHPKEGTPVFNPYSLPPTRLLRARLLADLPEAAAP